MKQNSHKILSVNDITNIENAIELCNKTNVPIIITNKNDNEVVMMSAKVYEELYTKIKEAVLINEGLEDITNNENFIEAKEFLKLMKEKLGLK